MSGPEKAAEWVAIGRVHRWAQNPRKNAAAVGPVVDSIKRFGFGAPLVARLANGELIAGHTRYDAAEHLGMKLVPVRFLDLTEDEAHRLALADNKAGEAADWDEEQLLRQLEEYRVEARDAAAVAGFTDQSIDALLEACGDGLLAGDGTSDDTPAKGSGSAGDLLNISMASLSESGKKRVRVPLTKSEAEKLAAIIDEYAERMGTLHGLAGRLIAGV